MVKDKVLMATGILFIGFIIAFLLVLATIPNIISIILWVVGLTMIAKIVKDVQERERNKTFKPRWEI